MRRKGERLLGGANVVFVLAGLYYFSALSIARWGRWKLEATALDWWLFALLTITSLILVVRLADYGIRMLRGDASILRSLVILFLIEIAYFLVVTVIDWVVLPVPLANRAVGFWEAGLDLLTPQYLTGYPLLGGIAAFLMMRKGKSGARVT